MRPQTGVGKLMPHQCKQMTYLWWRRRFRLRTAFFHSFSRSGLGLEHRSEVKHHLKEVVISPHFC